MSLGTAVLDLVVSDEKLVQGLKDSEQKTKQWASKAALAIAGVGAAVVGVGVAGVVMAKDFEKGMREVATLTPDVANDFQNLSKQVLDLSARLGTDAVGSTKALYQAISAGVPKDNALTFLEVASKAAIGGVTDTETAVDGLTTVLNAFKKDTSEVGKVADIMFATVRAGKTDFSQLSASLFNVAPIANTAGVAFEEVSAAVATLTKQGTPTSVATTQIRAAIQGLLKPSDEMTKIFNELGFESAAAAIKAKGLQFSLNAVREQTKGDVGAMQKLLGSVEAVSAALGTTGDNAEMFMGDLEAMQTAAGASEAAFQEMSKGLDQQLNIVRAAFDKAMITIGTKLLPLVTPLIQAIGEKLPAAFEVAERVIEPVFALLDVLSSQLAPSFNLVSEAVDFMYQTFVYALEDIASGNIKRGIGEIAESIIWILSWIGLASEENIEPVRNLVSAVIDGFISIRDTLMPIIDQVSALIGGNMQAVLVGVAAAIASIVVPAFLGLAATVASAIGAAVVALGAVLAPILAVGAAVALLYVAWQNNFLGIRDVVQRVLDIVVPFIERQLGYVIGWVREHWPMIQQTVENVMNAIQAVIAFVLDTVMAFWQGHGERLMSIVGSVWTIIQTVIETAIRNVLDVLKVVMQLISGDWEGAWETIKGILSRTWEAIKTIVGAAIDIVKNVLAIAWDGIKTVAAAGWNAIAGAIRGIWDGIVGYIKGKINEIIDAINGLLKGWNSLNFSVPGFDVTLPSVDVPGIGTVGGGNLGWGGIDLRTPQLPLLPRLHQGGIVPGRPGEEVLVLLEAGEEVRPRDQQRDPLIGSFTYVADRRAQGEDDVRDVLESLTFRARFGLGVP